MKEEDDILHLNDGLPHQLHIMHDINQLFKFFL